jgi:hypothetical protein
MAAACDGSIFPLKAVPQTLLLYIRHIEVRVLGSRFAQLHAHLMYFVLQGVRALAPRAEALIGEAVVVCEAVARHYQQQSFDSQLHADVDRFLE